MRLAWDIPDFDAEFRQREAEVMLTTIGVNRVFRSRGPTELPPLTALPLLEAVVIDSVPLAAQSHIRRVSSPYSC